MSLTTAGWLQGLDSAGVFEQLQDHRLRASWKTQVLKPLRPETRERIAAIAGKYVAYQQLYPTLRGDAC